MKNLMLCVMLVASLTACSSEKQTVLKSPCVGIEGSPCGPARAVNGWWQNAKRAS